MLHYFPLEHIPNRYTTHLDRDVVKYLDENKIDYIYYEPKTPTGEEKVSGGCFLNAVSTVYRQMYQMQQFLQNFHDGKVKDGDIVFITDLWNFAVPSFRYIKYFTGKKIKVYGLLHAGAFTDADIVHNMERTYHGFEETLMDVVDKIFVATQDFKNDIIKKRYVSPEKIEVAKLPLDFEGLDKFKNNNPKRNLVLFNGRHSVEKHPEMFEMLKQFRPQYEYIDTVAANLNRDEYYKAMSEAKVVISFADEETFGYGIQEALYLGAHPIVPNKLCYVEMYPSTNRYNTFLEAVSTLDKFMTENVCKAPLYVENNNEIFDKWFADVKNV